MRNEPSRIKIQGDFFAVQSSVASMMPFLSPKTARQCSENPYWDSITLFRKLPDGRILMRDYDAGTPEGNDPDDFLDADLETRWGARDYGARLIHKSLSAHKDALATEGVKIADRDTYAPVRTFNAYRPGDAPEGLGFILVSIPILVELFHLDPSDAARIRRAMLSREFSIPSPAAGEKFLEWSGWKIPDMGDFGQDDIRCLGEALLDSLQKHHPAELWASDAMLKAAEFHNGVLWDEEEFTDEEFDENESDDDEDNDEDGK